MRKGSIDPDIGLVRSLQADRVRKQGRSHLRERSAICCNDETMLQPIISDPVYLGRSATERPRCYYGINRRIIAAGCFRRDSGADCCPDTA